MVSSSSTDKIPRPEIPSGFDSSSLPSGAVVWPHTTVPSELGLKPEAGAVVVPIQYTDGAGVWYAALLNGCIVKVALVTPSDFEPNKPTDEEQASMDEFLDRQRETNILLAKLESEDLSLAEINTLLRTLHATR
jgi:hypothetical protein